MYEPKDLSGTLFKNDRKEKETQPDYKGTALIGGQEYFLSGWIKQGRAGKFLSLSFTAKQAGGPPKVDD